MRKTTLRKANAVSEAPAPAAQPTTPASAPTAPVKKAQAHTPIDMGSIADLAAMGADELAALMNMDGLAPAIKPGTKVIGQVTRIGRDIIFVDVGGKTEAQLSIEEAPNAKVGDSLEAFVIVSREAFVRISIKLSGESAGAFIEEAKETGLPVEGIISGHNAGGFEVKLGSERAFCPFSQMGRGISADRDDYIGQHMQFQVIETDPRTVLSRRALLEAENKVAADQFWLEAKEGDTRTGVVSSVQSFGVFVDLGGVDGLVPRREAGWGGSTDSFARGQRVSVRILNLDHEAKKITLSAKDPANSPWMRVGTEFIEGALYNATCVSVVEFGAFLELAPGLQGLMHRSRTAANPLPNKGDSVRVLLYEIDEDNQRLALAHVDFKPADDSAPRNTPINGTIREVLTNGVVVDLEDGRSAWLPAGEANLPAGTVLAQRYRRGRTIQARVKDVDPATDRVTLTQQSGTDDGKKAWRKQKRTQGKESLGTLADLLKGFKL